MCVCVRIIIMLWFCFCCLHAFYIRQEMCYASGVTPPVFKFPTFLTECTRGPSPQLYFDRRYNMFAISYGMYETCLDIFHVSMYLDLVNSSPWAARGLKIRQLSIYRFMIWKSLSIVHQITRLCQIHVPGQEAWKGAVVAIQALAAYHQWL